MKKIVVLLLTVLATCTLSFGQAILAEHHFESSEMEEVTVSGAFCDVYVTIGNTTIFDGIIQGDGKPGDYLIASMKSGDKVLFKVEQKRKKSGWSWNDIDKARLDLTIPDGTILTIDNTSGDVFIEGPASSSYVVKTTSGDIKLSELTGNLEVRSTSGDLRVDKVEGKMTSRSTSGDQELSAITGTCESRSTSGNIAIRRTMGQVIVGATSGDLELYELKGSVSGNTTSGDINGRMITLTSDSDVRTTSGDVRLRFSNDLDEIGFDLDATSGDLEVGEIEAEDRLLLKRGKYTFRGNSTSGDQEYTN